MGQPLETLVVRPYRASDREGRRGIATRLVRAAEEGLRRLGCPKVNLQVRASNREVVAFYASLGFEVEERVSMGRVLEQSAPAGDEGHGP